MKLLNLSYFLIIFIFLNSSCSLHKYGYKSIKSYEYLQNYNKKNDRLIDIRILSFLNEDSNHDVYKEIHFDSLKPYRLYYSYSPTYFSNFTTFQISYYINKYKQDTTINIDIRKMDTLTRIDYSLTIDTENKIFKLEKESGAYEFINYELPKSILIEYYDLAKTLLNNVDSMPRIEFPDISRFKNKLSQSYRRQISPNENVVVNIKGRYQEDEFVYDTITTRTINNKFSLDNQTIYETKIITQEGDKSDTIIHKISDKTYELDDKFVSETESIKPDLTTYYQKEEYKNEQKFKEIKYSINTKTRDTIFMSTLTTNCKDVDEIEEKYFEKGKSKISLIQYGQKPQIELEIKEKKIERRYDLSGNLKDSKSYVITSKGVKIEEHVRLSYDKKIKTYRLRHVDYRTFNTTLDKENFNYFYSCPIENPDKYKYNIIINNDLKDLMIKKVTKNNTPYYQKHKPLKVKKQKYRKHRKSYGGGYTELVFRDRKKYYEKRKEQVSTIQRLEYEIYYREK